MPKLSFHLQRQPQRGYWRRFAGVWAVGGSVARSLRPRAHGRVDQANLSGMRRHCNLHRRISGARSLSIVRSCSTRLSCCVGVVDSDGECVCGGGGTSSLVATKISTVQPPTEELHFLLPGYLLALGQLDGWGGGGGRSLCGQGHDDASLLLRISTQRLSKPMFVYEE